MKRLQRKAEHDAGNRDEALACINGKVYKGSSHADCINQFLAENNEQPRFIRRRPVGEIIDGDIDGLEQMAFAHLITNGYEKGIYLEEHSLVNMDLSEAAQMLKSAYPDYSIYNDDKEVEGYWESGNDAENQYQLIVAKNDYRKGR